MITSLALQASPGILVYEQSGWSQSYRIRQCGHSAARPGCQFAATMPRPHQKLWVKDPWPPKLEQIGKSLTEIVVNLTEFVCISAATPTFSPKRPTYNSEWVLPQASQSSAHMDPVANTEHHSCNGSWHPAYLIN